MNSLLIAKRLLLSKLREKETYLVYLAFPLVLIAILGFAFSGNFTDMDFSSNVIYHFKQNTEYTTSLKEKFKLIDSITFTQTNNIKEAEYLVSKGEYQLLLVIDGNNIELVHDNDLITKGIIESLLNYTDNSYVNVMGIKGKETPSSLDFYGLTIMSMMIMFGAFISAFSIITEKNSGTLSRVIVAPVKKHEFFFGISLGSLIQILIQNLVLITIGHFVLGINYGTRPIAFGAIIISTSFMVVALGFFLAITFNSERIISSTINLSVQIFVFIGGGYFQLPDSGPIAYISKFSPVYWINNGLLEAVHSTKSQYVIPGFLVPTVLGLLLFGLSQFSIKRGEK